MGSPVSAVIVEFVIQEVEEKGLEPSPIKPKMVALPMIPMRASRETVYM